MKNNLNSQESRKKNILIVTSSLTIGGAELVIYTLCKNIDRNKFNVSVCHLKELGATGESLSGIGIDVYGIKRNKNVPGKYFSFLQLLRLIKRLEIDVVHCHTTYALLDASMCKLFRPSLKLFHTFHYGNYPRYPLRYKVLEFVAARVATKLVAVGFRQGAVIKKMYWLRDSRMDVIHNGIEINRNDVNSEVKQRLGKLNKAVIGSISTFIEQKGLKYLIEVAVILKKKRNDFVFVLCGDGVDRAVLESEAHSLGLDDVVIFLGWQENAGNTILPLFDIFVQSSLWEAMSMVVLEAMSKSKPVVVTNVGDNERVVEDGVSGTVVKPKDTSEMAEALDRLLNESALRIKMGERGKLLIEKNYTAKVMAEKYENLYQGGAN